MDVFKALSFSIFHLLTVLTVTFRLFAGGGSEITDVDSAMPTLQSAVAKAGRTRWGVVCVCIRGACARATAGPDLTQCPLIE